MKIHIRVLAAFMAAGTAQVFAQTIEPAIAPQASDTTVVSVLPAPHPQCSLAAGTLVELEITELLSSARQKRGDKFALKLHAPVSCNGEILIDVDTTGVGEIVHAEPSHGGGKPGELLLAARYLERDGTRWPLRGLKFGGNGQDNTKAALAASFALGPFAHFIHGKEIEIPAGTVVTAKLAQEFPNLATTAPGTTASAVSSVPPPTPSPTAPAAQQE